MGKTLLPIDGVIINTLPLLYGMLRVGPTMPISVIMVERLTLPISVIMRA